MTDPATDDTTLFAFEDVFVARLQCVPMAVRFKLDLAGVKITLRQWSRFSVEARRALLLSPCRTPDDVERYKERLTALLDGLGEAPRPLPPGSTVPWRDQGRTPPEILRFAALTGARAPTDREWGALSSLQRFVLLKLSRDNHDNVNFLPALREFGLYGEAPDRAGAAQAARA